jgi:2-desacetyl-2-hydroxyethyl bacteriochlorophyllide A dehydrogenase
VRAVVFEDVGRVSAADVPEPSVSVPDDAIVRVTASAICGSDLHFFHGKAPLEPGDVMGHEAVGVVETVGPGVEAFAPGQRVVASFVIACGTCWFCRAGQTSLCEELAMPGTGLFGGGLPGAQAEQVRIPHADVNLLAVPDDVEDDRALFLGDVLTTALYGAATAGIREGDTVAVIGAGPVGFLAAQAARGLGASEVVVLDLETDRLALAEGIGMTPIDTRTQHAQMAVAELTGGRGADVVIEAVGTPSAFESALDVVRRGGTVSVVGMYTSETVEAQLGVWWARALTVRFAGICPVHSWWERALDELRAGRIDPRPLISHRLPLADAPRGYELFDTREATKVLLLP